MTQGKALGKGRFGPGAGHGGRPYVSACVQMKHDLPPRRQIAPVPFAWQWSPAVVVANFLLFSRQVAPGTYTIHHPSCRVGVFVCVCG